MRRRLGLSLCGALVLACSNPGGDATLPPPPPPPTPVTPEVPPEPPPPADLLPPPWGDLGLRYGTATVAKVDPGVVLLTAPPADVAALDVLYADWQKALAAQGYTTAGGGWKIAEDAADPYVKGDQRVSIAHGVVREVAYLYAEDLQKVDPSAVATQAVDGAVLKLLPGEEPTAVAEEEPKLKPGELPPKLRPTLRESPREGKADRPRGKRDRDKKKGD